MVSMPYLGDMRHDDFFAAGAVAVDGSATEDGSSHLGPSLPNVHVTRQRTTRQRQRQHTAPGFFAIESSPSAAAGVSLATGSSVPTAMRQRSAGRKKTNSFMAGLLARRAVGLDLLPSEEAEIGVYEFFARPEDFAEGSSVLTPMPEGWDQGEEETKEEVIQGGKDEEAGDVEGGEKDNVSPSDDSFNEQVNKPQPKLFKPLVFAPRVFPKGSTGGHGHGGVGHSMPMPPRTQNDVEQAPAEVVVTGDEAVPLTSTDSPSPKKEADFDEEDDEAADLIGKFDDSQIIKATRKDYFFTGALFCVMCALVGVVLGWHTRLDESHSIFGPIGLAW